MTSYGFFFKLDVTSQHCWDLVSAMVDLPGTVRHCVSFLTFNHQMPVTSPLDTMTKSPLIESH